MKRICPRCHFIGLGRRRGSLLLGGFAIGLGLFYYAALTSETDKSSVFVFVLLVVMGLFTIVYYYKFGKKCPNCGYRNMPSIDEPAGLEIIKQNGLVIEDTPTHICTACNHKMIKRKKHNLIISILLILFGLILALLSLFMNEPIGFLGSLIITGTGIFGVLSNIFTNNKCPYCNNKSLTAFPKTNLNPK